MASCAATGRRSQSSIRIAILRTTMHVPPASHAGSLAGGSQTCWSMTASFASRMLLEPSLKPMRLRGVCWPVGVLRRAHEAHLRPADRCPPDGDARQVAHRVHRDLRIVGADLDTEVTVAPGRVPARRRRTTAGVAAPAVARSEVEAVDSVALEQPRSHPDRDGQPARRQTQGFTRCRRAGRAGCFRSTPAVGSPAPGSCTPLHPTSRATGP